MSSAITHYLSVVFEKLAKAELCPDVPSDLDSEIEEQLEQLVDRIKRELREEFKSAIRVSERGSYDAINNLRHYVETGEDTPEE